MDCAIRQLLGALLFDPRLSAHLIGRRLRPGCKVGTRHSDWPAAPDILEPKSLQGNAESLVLPACNYGSWPEMNNCTHSRETVSTMGISLVTPIN